jgi:hypothetical protein
VETWWTQVYSNNPIIKRRFNMSYNWGPHSIVPTEVIKNYSGSVLLREEFDEDLLRKEMEEIGLTGRILRVTNPWYYRKKNSDTWIKIGESDDIRRNFPVRWDTTNLENGQYEVLGLMHAFVRKEGPASWDTISLANGQYEAFGYKPIVTRKGSEETAIARQNVVEVTVEN